MRARLSRASGGAPPPALNLASVPQDDPELLAELLREEAAVGSAAASAVGEVVEARRSPRAVALLDLELGLQAVRSGEVEEGRRRVYRAAAALGELGLVRDHARSLLRLAEIARGVPDDAAPAALARAQAVLGARATWRDRLALFNGFQSYGRRIFDKALADGAAARIEAFERARGALLSALATRRAAAARAIDALALQAGEGTAAGALRENERGARAGEEGALARVNQSVKDLVNLVGAALVERGRLRVLLSTLADLDSADDTQLLPPLAARAVARVLDADYVVIAMD